MARIKTYAIDATPTIEDKVIGTNVDDANLTQNYKIGDIIALVPGGLSSVQSLNTLTGVVKLVEGANISLAVDATKNEIEISSTGGAGGITSVDGATGPAIDLAGKGGITITAVGNLINIDGSGIGGGNPAAPDFGIQYNQGGVFEAGEFFKVDLSAKLNPAVNIGYLSGDTPIKGQLNIFSGSGDVSPFGEVRWYNGLGNYASWASPGRVEKSYAVALPANEPTSIDQVLAIKAVTTGPNSPAEAVWKTISSGGGTVTDVSVLVNPTPADAIDLRVFNSSTTPRIELDFNGVIDQYINGAGELKNFNAMTTLTTTGTSGEATYDSSTNTLNVPNYAGGSTAPAGVAGSIQINDGTNFSADTNLTWDTTNNILTVGNENNPVFQEGILRLKGNGSNLGGRVQFQTGIGKASAAIVTLQAPEAGTKQEISLPGALPSDIGLVLGVKTITGTEVETEWKTAGGGGGGTVTSVGGTAPIASSGGNTPSISIGESSESVDGYLSSTNFTAFKGKQAALVSGTNIKSINGNSLLGSGNLVIGSSATPGGSNYQIQYNNNGTLDGDSKFVLVPTPSVTTVTIGNSEGLSVSYGKLELRGNNSTEGGKIEFETGGGRVGSELITLQAPDTGVSQQISLPDNLPTADTQILGIKSINGTGVQTQWETPTGGGGAVSQIIAGDNISVDPAEGTGAVTVNVTGISAPKYTSYEATFITSGGVAAPNVLNNTIGITPTWTDTRLGQINIGLSGIPDNARIWVMVNGYGASKEEGKIQCFFGGLSGKSILIIDKLNERFLVEDTDIVAGNIEIRIY